MMQSTIPINSNECNAANLFLIGSIKEMSPEGLILYAQPRHVAGDELLFLLRFFNVVFNHELAPERNLLADKVT